MVSIKLKSKVISQWCADAFLSPIGASTERTTIFRVNDYSASPSIRDRHWGEPVNPMVKATLASDKSRYGARNA